MPGTVVTTDIDVTLRAEELDETFFEGEMNVIEAEIERVFGGGGSTASIDVIFSDFLENRQRERFQELIRADSLDDLPDDKYAEGLLTVLGVEEGDLPDRINTDDTNELRKVSQRITNKSDIVLDEIVPDGVVEQLEQFDTKQEFYEKWASAKEDFTVEDTQNIEPSGPLEATPFIPSLAQMDIPQTVEGLENTNVRKKIAISEFIVEQSGFAVLESGSLDFMLNVDKERVGEPLPHTTTTFEELPISTNLVNEDNRPIPGEQLREITDIRMTVDVEVQNPLLQVTNSDAETTIRQRVFTGTVTKVSETSDRKVTFEAIDKRFQLNRNSVIYDANNDSAALIIENVMNQLGYKKGEEYDIISFNDSFKDVTFTGVVWGLKQHTTVFELLQDVIQEVNGTIHIDADNTIVFLDAEPPGTLWTDEQIATEDIESESHSQSVTLPPIVEWANSEDENDTHTVATAQYDETGLGIYSTVGEEEIRETLLGEQYNVDINDWQADKEWGGVTQRNLVENEGQYSVANDIIMRDSGNINIIGDPRVRPYDNITLNDQTVDVFSPISTGTYMTKTVRHIFSSKDGYVTEIELGESPAKLFEEFASRAGQDPEDEDGNNISGGSSGPIDQISGWINGGVDALNPFD